MEKIKIRAGAAEQPTEQLATRYANKDVLCPGWDDRIDLAVCIARSARHPERCAGCPVNY